MMKKILPLLAIVLLLCACGGSTESGDGTVDVTSQFNTTWNINEDIVTNEDGTVTYDAVLWGGLAANFAKEGVPANWSGYDALTFEFVEPTKVETQIIVLNKFTTRGNKGITRLTAFLDGQDVSAVTDVALQAVEPTTLRIKRVYLQPTIGEWYSTTIWDGERVFGQWADGVIIPPEKFATVADGNRLEFVYTTDPTAPFNYWQIKTVDQETELTLEGNASELNDWGCATVDGLSTDYRIMLTANDAANLREHGLFVNGYFLVLKQINLLQKFNDNVNLGF